MSEVESMKILARLNIPAFYSAIRYEVRTGHDKRNPDSGKYVKDVVYHCLNCKTDFRVQHRERSTMFGSAYGDDFVTCPACSKHHMDFRRKEEICEVGTAYTPWAPLGMQLTVKETRDCVILRAVTEVMAIDTEKDSYWSQVEEFRFDVKHRRTTWTVKNMLTQGKTSCELGNPFDWSMLHSALWHLRSSNLSRKYLRQAGSLLQTMRKAIRRKWKELHGYDIGSLFVSYGRVYGRLLFPLMNIAYRLVYATAVNLPKWFGCDHYERQEVKNFLCVNAEMFRDLDCIRQSNDSVQAVAKLFSLPETPLILGLLRMNVFQANYLRKLLMLVQDQNYLEEAAELIPDLAGYGQTNSFNPNYLPKVLDQLQTLKDATGRSGTDIMHYLRWVKKNYGISYVSDTVHMWGRLPQKDQLESRKVKLKKLHDWCVNRLTAIEEQGFPLKVPPEITKRLAMQMDQVKFFLPQHSRELIAGSRIFHNCVRTYANRVLDRKCQIVFMTDDRGKLVACLEIRGDKLVQAKLKFNKPVATDSAVNGAVVDWCNRVGLKLACYGDVREMRYPVEVMAV